MEYLEFKLPILVLHFLWSIICELSKSFYSLLRYSLFVLFLFHFMIGYTWGRDEKEYLTTAPGYSSE